MYILADAQGAISYIGIVEIPRSTKYAGTIPDDFNATFALGKYKFVAGSIVPVEGWVAPLPPPPPFDFLKKA